MLIKSKMQTCVSQTLVTMICSLSFYRLKTIEEQQETDTLKSTDTEIDTY